MSVGVTLVGFSDYNCRLAQGQAGAWSRPRKPQSINDGSTVLRPVGGPLP